MRRERIEVNRVEGFRRCLRGESARAAMEASWNWTKNHEILEGLEGPEEVVLANPLSAPDRRCEDQNRQGGRGGLRDAVAGQRPNRDRERRPPPIRLMRSV